MSIQHTIQQWQELTGLIVRGVNAVLFGIFTLGAAFILLTLPLMKAWQNPYEIFQGQAFMMNAMQLNAERSAGPANDPSWDGALSGMGTGYVFARGIPFVWVAIGPLLGAAVGYRVDQDL